MVVREVHRQQGAANVTVRNIITSLRLISDVDWQDLFEQMSLVDSVLAEARLPRHGFPDAQSLPQRHRGSGAGFEPLGTRHRMPRGRLGSRGQAATCSGAVDARGGDPGYYLLAGGRGQFETAIGFRPPLLQRLARLNSAVGIGGYAAAIAAVTGILLALPLLLLATEGLGAASLWLLAALGIIPAIDAAVALVNRAVSFGFGPVRAAGLELREGVPAASRTLVAVPTLLTTPDAIEQQIERLEIHYLASPDGDLHFALLSDWLDAATQHADGDEALLAAAAEQIADSTGAMARRLAGPASCCCIASASGMPAKGAGSAGSASAASCMN